MSAHARPWPRDPRYLVGTDGTIQGPSARVRKQHISKYGRATLTWNKGRKGDTSTVQVAVIVCETFHGPRPEGMSAAHIDGNKLNNSASNLAWKTAKENAEDRVLHGTQTRGEAAVAARQHNLKLTPEDVEEMRRRRKNGERVVDLAAEFGVTRQHASAVIRRINWSFVA